MVRIRTGVTVGAVLLGGLVAAGAVVGAEPFGLSFGTDAMRNASTRGTTASVSASTVVDGYEFTVRGVIADSTLEVIALDVVGGDEQRDLVVFGPTFLVDRTGAAVPLKRSNGDPANPRSIALQFPALADQSGEWELRVSGLFVRSRSQAESSPPKALAGFTLKLDPDLHVADDPRATLTSPAKGPLNVASVVVSEVILAPSGTVVRGRFEGFSELDQQVLQIEFDLQRADGGRVPLEFGRRGFGDGAAQFEYRFPILPPGKYSLTVTSSLAEGVVDSPAQVSSTRLAELAGASGTVASFELSVP